MATPKYAGVDLSYANANVDYVKLAAGSLEGCRVKFAMLPATPVLLSSTPMSARMPFMPLPKPALITWMLWATFLRI